MKLKQAVAVLSAVLGMATSGQAQDFLTNGLVAYYPFNGNANDESGQGNNGIAYGATLTVDRLGQAASAYGFNGTDNYVSAVISNLPSGGAPRTMTAWIMPTKAHNDAMLGFIGYGAGGQASQFGLSIDPDQGISFWGGYADFSPHLPAPLGTWSFVAVSYSNNAVQLSVNGIAATGAGITLNTPNNGRFFFGVTSMDGNGPSWPAGPWENWFTGSIDEVRIYDRALSDQEVKDLYAYERPVAGTRRWTFLTGGWVYSSPAIGLDGEDVFVGSDDGNLYALNRFTGAKKWSFQTGGRVFSSPALGLNNVLYFGSFDTKVYAVNAATGQKKWEFQTGGEIYSSPALGSESTVYIGGNDKTLYAIDATTGQRRWSFLAQGIISSSPAIGPDGTVFFAGDQRIYALDGKTGAKRWEFKAGSGIFSSPALGSNGRLYIGSADRKVYALDSASGSKAWELGVGNIVECSPAVGSDDTVYVGSHDSKLYAINGDSGVVKWSFQTKGFVYSSPLIASDGTVYVCDRDGFTLYALDPTSGTARWEYKAGDLIHSSPGMASDGTLYFGSNDKQIHAVYSDSLGLADSPWPRFRGGSRSIGRRTADASPNPRVAAGVPQVVNGFVVGIAVSDSGYGYTSNPPPLVSIRDTSGTEAAAHAVVMNGFVVEIVIDNPGRGYSTNATVLIARPATLPSLSVAVKTVSVQMTVVLGRKYQLHVSTDLKNWVSAGEPFVADDNTITKDFDVVDTGRFFRIEEVP
jgi:outer membrane protein assembly factor BamB